MNNEDFINGQNNGLIMGISLATSSDVEIGMGSVDIWRRIPTQPDSQPNPDGVFDITQLRRLELLTEATWRQMVEDNLIDPNVLYLIP